MTEEQKAALKAQYEKAMANGMNPADLKDPQVQELIDATARAVAESFDLTKPFEYAEKLIGVPGFFVKIINEDDWTVIIKLHALIESVLSHALADALKVPELIDLITWIPTSDRKYGKVKFLKELELLSDEQSTFIYKLSELRNEMAHNAKNVTFSLKDYLAKKKAHEVKAFFTSIIGKEVVNAWTNQQVLDYKETPKKVLAIATFSVIASLMFFAGPKMLRRERKKAKENHGQ